MATVEPDQVTVTGFASALEKVDEVSTVRVQVPADGVLTASGRARLMLPGDVRASVSSVSYDLHFGFVTQEIWVKLNLEPVAYDSFSYTVNPTFIRVNLAVPVRLLKDKDWREQLHMIVDPGANPALGQSVIKPDPRFPEGVSILESKPEEIEIVVHRNDPLTPLARRTDGKTFSELTAFAGGSTPTPCSRSWCCASGWPRANTFATATSAIVSSSARTPVFPGMCSSRP